MIDDRRGLLRGEGDVKGKMGPTESVHTLGRPWT